MATPGEFLQSISIFNTLTEAELALLAAQFKPLEFDTGARIVHEGEVSDNFFVVQEGFVNVMRGEKDEEVFITTLAVGEYFGEAALFHNINRTANVVSAVKTRLLVISKMAFHRYLQANPLASNKILFEMLKQVFLRLSTTSGDLKFKRAGSLNQNAVDKLFT